MTSEVFSDWVQQLNKTYQKKKEPFYLLFIDNCTSHNTIILVMQNVKEIFFLPNMDDFCFATIRPRKHK